MGNLVSIITPCYNGEKYVHRLLDSILNQTYKNIELIFVDDGSTDRTKEIVLSYEQKFIEKSIHLKYIHQDNTGLAGAINNGLRNVDGVYLCWPDSDDYLEPRSIELRAEILDKYPEYAVVTSDSYVRDVNDLNGYMSLASKGQQDKFEENQFELLLNGTSMFIPGTHMVRVKCFFETHPDGQIFPCRRGQNWQMLLPLYYKYKRYFLDKPLYNYIIYSNSMSQGDVTEEKKLFRCDEHESIILNTLDSMNMEGNDKDKYKHITKINYEKKRLTVAYHHKNKGLFQRIYSNLKVEDQIERKEQVYKVLINNRALNQLFNLSLPLFKKLIKVDFLKSILYNKRFR